MGNRGKLGEYVRIDFVNERSIESMELTRNFYSPASKISGTNLACVDTKDTHGSREEESAIRYSSPVLAIQTDVSSENHERTPEGLYNRSRRPRNPLDSSHGTKSHTFSMIYDSSTSQRDTHQHYKTSVLLL